MQIGTFRRHVMKTLNVKATKVALRTVSKNTTRTQIAQGVIALNSHSGELLQKTTPYLLGLQPTQEMKDDTFKVMGDIGYDLTLLCRVLKVKMPSSTKKVKLVGTRSAALLRLAGVSASLLSLVEQGAFVSPKMTTVKKMVTMPNKGGVKEERDVEVVDAATDTAAEMARQTEMKLFVAAALDLYWRLCFDMFGKSPVSVLEDKFKRMQQEYPHVTFDTETKPKVKKSKKEEAVPA